MTIQLQKILLPTDFSRASAGATSYACELAARFGAELHVLHTLEHQLSAAPGFGMGLAMPTFVNESQAAAERAIERIPDAAWTSGRPVVRSIVEGSPAKEIVQYARTENIDLIVLSTHGRTGLSHVLLGSVAEAVVRMAPCPVFTVPSRLETAEESGRSG